MLYKNLLQIIILIIGVSVFSVKYTFAFDTKAKQAIMLEYPSMQIIFEKNATQFMAPSSMTKLLTVYIIFDQLREGNLKLDDMFFVSKKAWSKGGTKMFLEYNTKVSVKELLRGTVVQSGNDACIVLAEGISGSVSGFIKLMNIYTKKLGMKNSYFTNPTGWPDEDLKSTAYDIAILSAKLIHDFPEYYHYFAETEFSYNNIRQFNRNPLLGKNGVDGLKTGQTDKGGFGVAISAKKKNRRLIMVVNGLSSKRERAIEADKLLSYGFSSLTKHHLFKLNEEVIKINTWYGSEDTVSAVGKDHPITVTLPRHTKFKAMVTYNTPIVAPIAKGQKIGQLVIKDQYDYVYTEIDLVAKEEVKSSNIFRRFIQNIQYLIAWCNTCNS